MPPENVELFSRAADATAIEINPAFRDQAMEDEHLAPLVSDL